MDAGVSAASTSRLLEAFERSGLSQGAGLVSSGPSPVPADVAQRFAALMDQPVPEMPSGAALEADVRMFEAHASTPVSEAAKSGSGDGVRVGEAPEQIARTEGMTELTPMDLYQQQFQVGMLRFHADFSTKASQHATQGLDTLLRQQS